MILTNLFFFIPFICITWHSILRSPSPLSIYIASYLPTYLPIISYYHIRVMDSYFIQLGYSFNDLIHFDTQIVPDVASVSHFKLAPVPC